MKLTVFHAADGDCLMLSSSDDHHCLIDGGRTESFRDNTWRALRRLEEAGKPIDLVVVSHIDADHITGILWMLNAIADWTVFDHQTTDGGNPDFPEPSVDRPPEIKKIWHNAWRAQLGDLSGEIEAFARSLGRALRSVSATDLASKPGVSEVVEIAEGIAQSIPQGVELRRVIDEATPIPRNDPFSELVLLTDPPHVEKLGKARLTVLGPAKKHLTRLRKEWRRWLDDLHEAAGTTPETRLGTPGDRSPADLFVAADAAPLDRLIAAAEIITKTDPKKVTPPNRASITLLAEENKRTCLLTGDAAEEEILEGLTKAGRIDDGRFRCDILKVQHHGSEYNLSQEFAKTVIADHYVFCADGAHHNPDPSVVKTIVETRLAEDSDPFTVWFNCSPKRTLESRRDAMDAAISEAKNAVTGHQGTKVRVLADSKPFFEIEI